MLLNDNCSGPWEEVLGPTRELFPRIIQSGVGGVYCSLEWYLLTLGQEDVGGRARRS